MVVGGASLFLLLTISHFWYGMWRYPSLWNSMVPLGLKGCTLDENFAEIRDICSYYYNGHDRTNTQMVAFLVTLPFTLIFHVNAFLVTAIYYVFKISRNEGKDNKFPAPITTSLFVSNIIVTLLWFLGGRTGVILATATAFFNQKLYNSLLFQRSLKDFCFSLLFGNLVVIQTKIPIAATGDKGIALSEQAPVHDLEAARNEVEEECNSQTSIEKSDVGREAETKSVQIPLPVPVTEKNRSLPSLLGASNSFSPVNSLIDEECPGETIIISSYIEPPNNNISSATENIISLQIEEDMSQADDNNKYQPPNFDEECASQKSEEALKHLVTVLPMCKDLERYEDEIPHSPQPSKEKYFSIASKYRNVAPISLCEENLERKTDQIPYSDLSPQKRMCKHLEINTEEIPNSSRSSKSKFFGLSPKTRTVTPIPLCADFDEHITLPRSSKRKIFGLSPRSRHITAMTPCEDRTKHAEEMPFDEHITLPRSSRKKFFGRSRRSSIQKNGVPSQIHIEENESDDEMSIEFLNPSDVHLDIENHPGTIAWRNVISESIQRFKIRSYTLRKHNWVMNRMHGKYFFIKEDGKRRRKLKRKEIKERSKSFHDKQLEFRYQISGILDDLKDLKKNHNSKSSSDHTRKSLANIPVVVNEKPGFLSNEFSTGDEEYKNHEINHIIVDYDPKSAADAASSAKDSLMESSKESTVSTLTQSIISSVVIPEEARNTPWITGPAAELKETNKNDDVDSSASFRDAINGLLEYTSWLDNMNPLKETGTTQKEGPEEEEGEDKVGVQKALSSEYCVEESIQNMRYPDAETPVEMVDGGNVKDSKNMNREAYWRSFVDEKKIVKPNFSKKQKKGEEDSPHTILLDGNTGSFIDNVNSRSRERRKLYPIWKNALQLKKSKKAKADRSEMKEAPVKEKKRVTSIWRKKKEPFKVIVQENITSSANKFKSKRLEHLNESNQDDRRETVENRRGNDGSRQNIKKTQHNTTIYDDILNIMDDKHLRIWEDGDSSFENDDPKKTTSKQPKLNNMSCNTECGALEDITGVCAQQDGTERDDEDFLSDIKLVGTHRINRVSNYE